MQGLAWVHLLLLLMIFRRQHFKQEKPLPRQYWWGNNVFSTANPSKCWDGIYKGVGQGTAVYVYSISAITICGPVVRKGTVVLLR